MKLLGVCLVLAGCAGMGIYFCTMENVRYQNLLELARGMAVLRGEISARRTPLPDALFQVSERTKGSVSDFFASVAESLTGGGGELAALWSRNLEERFPKWELRGEDRRELDRMGGVLGYLDVEMQLQNIGIYRQRLEFSLKSQEKKTEKNSRLYPVLGWAAGVLFCILLL